MSISPATSASSRTSGGIKRAAEDESAKRHHKRRRIEQLSFMSLLMTSINLACTVKENCVLSIHNR